MWEIGGVRCGALICYDYRFPELYREYNKRGVQVMFHSFHAARATAERMAAMAAALGPRHKALNPAATFTYPGITMPAAMTTAAACNHMWISCPNSSAPQSCWPAFFVRADGVTIGQAAAQHPGRAALGGRHRAGAVRLHRRLARPGHARHPAQRRPSQRPALRRPHPHLSEAQTACPAIVEARLTRWCLVWAKLG